MSASGSIKFLSIWILDGSKYIFWVLKVIFHIAQKVS